MKKFSQGGFGGPKKFGFKPGGFNKGGDFGGEKQMFSATCGSCNNDCKVPFKPNGRKPVLCSDCFRKEGGNDSFGEKRFGGSDRFEKPRFGEKRPYMSTPRFPRAEGGNNAEIEKRLKAIEDKIDSIIAALEDGI